MFGFSIGKWIPENRREEVMIQQFVDAVDYLLSVDFPYSDALANSFESLRNKYRNVNDIPLEDLEALLKETGYNYITDTIDLDESQLRNFLNFLNFIHINKGTKKGLELVLKLLEVDFKFTEWWENGEEEHTFTVDLLALTTSKIPNTDFLFKLRKFTDNYVYPILKKITLEIRNEKNRINVGGVGYPDSEFYFMPDSIWLIWGFNEWTYKLWYTDESIILTMTWDIDNWDSKNWE